MHEHNLGVFTTAELLRGGMSKWQLTLAMRSGMLIPLRRGWHALASAEPAAVNAALSFGAVSCFSALRIHGVWVPKSQQRLHLRHLKRHRTADSCFPHGSEPPLLQILDDIVTAFRCAVRCGNTEELLVVSDSLLHQRLLAPAELRACTRDAPKRKRAALALADASAESGTESLVRIRLRSRHLRVRTQVQIENMRVDIVVGERLVIECDSRAHHTDFAAYQRDRERDRRLLQLGFLVLRVSYEQVHEDWAAVEAAILDLVRRQDHRA